MQFYSHLSVSYCCRLFGKSRQAYYEQKAERYDDGLRDMLVLKLVEEIRSQLPRCGTDKLHFMLKGRFAEHGIKLGRDGLYALLGRHGLLIRHRSRKPYTTNSTHSYKVHPNLIRDLVLTRAGRLWVSDITYIRKTSGFSYLSIVTDAYSRKIVGYSLYPSLQARGPLDALAMACQDKKRGSDLIHHSDRGIQYCCCEYVQMARELGIRLSMSRKGDPYENAIAERVNGILKHEHGLKAVFNSETEAQEAVNEAIRKYNALRIHDSCGRLTPQQAHDQNGILNRHWKPKSYKRSEQRSVKQDQD